MPLLDKPAMICGLDVYHATHLGRKSVLGFCASYNNTATKYWSKSIIKDVGVEAVVHLQSLVDKAIKKFYKLTRFYPARLFFYRDGLGDKQVKAIANEEVEQIKRAFKELGIADKIGFVYILVCKRVNTRIYA